MGIKFANNAFSSLASGITNVATSLTVQTGQGARFPSVSAAPDHFWCTLIDGSGNIEVVKVTARSGDVFTIVRGQDGTSGIAFSTNDLVQLRIPNAALKNLQQEGSFVVSLAGSLTYTGTLDPIPTGYNTDQIYWVRVGTTNSATDPTVNLSSIGARTIKAYDGGQLPVSALPINVAIPLHYDGTNMRMPPQLMANPAAAEQTLTDAANVDWNMNLGGIGVLTLGGNRNMNAPTNLKKGTYLLHVIQSGGSNTLTWNAVFKWPAATAPVLTTAAGRRDILSFVCDGTNLYGSFLPDVR